ncbi:hypothetical protein DERF_002756 [Dermatophagoides farinae]|uniref:Uncharacterized protein n=1 Tax=Dermatophagoides farinae TaxID=6954 RepID=A0A922IEY0_DERFA|nr:hypothetical protein DERF_002756 [Dermatophagoides farinae]
MFFFKFFTFFSIISITISDPPKLLPFNVDLQELVENITYPLTCVLISGSKPIFFEWYRNDEKVAERLNVKIDNQDRISLLSLTNVQTSDSGKYECYAKNQFGQDSIVTNILVKAPKLAENIHNQTLLIGSKFKFFCYLQSSGSRPLHFEWLKDGQILRHYGDKLTSYTISTTEDDTLFSIDKIRLNDTGSYTCLVRNSYGSDSKTISLTVKVPSLGHFKPSESLNVGHKFKLFCYPLAGVPQFQFEWFKNGHPLSSSPSNNHYIIEEINDASLFTIETLQQNDSGNYSCRVRNRFGHDIQSTRLEIKAPQLLPSFRDQINQNVGNKFRLVCSIQKGIEPLEFEWFRNGIRLITQTSNVHLEFGDDFSNLIITKLSELDSGNYTCRVQNDFGSDQWSVKLNVQVPPTWIVEPKDTHTNGKENVRMECKADGSPKPTIKWITSKGITIESEYLDVNKYRTANVDTYECVADNGVGEPLRKSIKFASLKVKRSESVRLECNATGDQPLTVQWTKNNVKLDKLGSNYEIIDTNTDDGIRSELFIQTSQTMTDDAHTSIYKCFVENEHGKDERTIRLEVVEVPGMPKNVHVKEVWSRTVSLSWSEPFNGNLPIQKYTVQYWRYQSAPHRLNEVFVPGSQTSFFLKDLSPGQSYELSVIAENEIGKGASSAPVTFTTGEEEPSAPPNDISLESMGPSTVRLVWRSPPIENWNGEITGYYVGYRKARDNNSPYVYITVPTSAASRDSNQAQKTRPKEITFHEYFLRQLNKGTEYSVVVKAYNSAGSGPQSHPMVAHTFDGDLPPAFQLNVIDNTEETISLQWYQKLPHSNYPQSAISGYTIHYRKENEAKWKEVPISNNNANQPTVDPNSSFNSYSFVLENLEHNAKYMIYLVAINRFGVGDPSNVITARTHNGMAVVSHEVIRRFHGANYYLEPLFLWPLLFALVIIIIVMIVAYVCILNLDAATLNKRLSAAYNVGTTPRYADFEKTANKTLLMSIDGQPPTSATAGYPTPYAASTPWERPLPNPQTMKKDGHIYDHPQ